MRLRRLLLLGASLSLLSGCDDGVSDPRGGNADHTPPQPVADLTAVYQDAIGAVELTWTAPRDDFLRDRVARYEVRVAYAAPFAWDRAAAARAGPEPGSAGSPQSYSFTGALRGRDLYAAVRSYDGAGNESPLSNVAHVRVPGVSLQVTCVEAISRLPVPGLAVQVTSASSLRLSTDAFGRVSLPDLAEGLLGIRIESGDASLEYHLLTDAIALDGDRALAYPMIEYSRPVSTSYESLLELLLAALAGTGRPGVIKHWAAYPISWYAGAFVNSHGLDYRAAAERAATRWNDRTGMEIFTPSAAPPDTGVVMRFLPRSVMGIQNGITEYSNDAGGYPLLDTIKIVDEFSDEQQLYLIMMHELGHAIRLGHLPAGFIMFAGQPLPPDITDDEAQLVRLLVSLPNGLDLAIYDPAPPH